MEYDYPQDNEIPVNTCKLKRGAAQNRAVGSKIRNKRENSEIPEEREDSPNNEEYIKLLENSFPNTFDDNNIVLNIGEVKPGGHVRVKRN